MKGIWMLAAAALLTVGMGCTKKVDTLGEMESVSENTPLEVTGVTKSSTGITEGLDEDLSTDAMDGQEIQAADDSGVMDSSAAAMAFDFKDIYFDYDRAAVRPADKTALQANAALIKQNPGVVFSVEGHCDARGTTAYNLALGERRAVATRRALIASGVNPAQVKAVSYGEERPLCAQESETCWRQNRRSHVSSTR